MPTNTFNPVMGMTIPTAGQEPGTQYAVEVSDALAIIATHTHTGAANLDGYQVPSAGINIDDDLSFNNHNLTDIRATRFHNQVSTLVGVGDINCIYVTDGDLWFNDGSGTPVQIIDNGQINVNASNNFSTKEIINNYTINASDGYVVFNADPTLNTILVTLPLANAVPVGRFYYVKDKTGQAGSFTITVQKAGSDTIDGTTNTLLDSPYASAAFFSDGTSNWSAYLFDRKKYHSGETLTFQSGSIINESGTLNLLSGSSLNVNDGAASDINISSGSVLRGRSGATTQMDSGSATTFQSGSILQAVMGVNSQLTTVSVGNMLHATETPDAITLGNTTKSDLFLDGYQHVSIVTGSQTPLYFSSGVSTANQISIIGALLANSITTSTTPYAMDSSVTGQGEIFVFMDASGGSKIVTLPPPILGRIVGVIDWKGAAGTHTIQINPNVSEKISGSAVKQLTANWSAAFLTSDGIDWFIIGYFGTIS